MSNDTIRKNNSLGTLVAQLQVDFKTTHARYSDLIGDLAILMKSELRPIFKSLKDKPDINGIVTKVDPVFDKIDNVLYDMADTHIELDEILQNIGGLEFSTGNAVDKLSEILKYQENQQARMTLELNHVKDEFDRKIKTGENIEINSFIEDIEDFQLEFSRFQDYVQDSVPRVSKVFDELDEEERKGQKFGKSKKI